MRMYEVYQKLVLLKIRINNWVNECAWFAPPETFTLPHSFLCLGIWHLRSALMGLLFSDWTEQMCVWRDGCQGDLRVGECEAEIFNCPCHVASTLLCSSTKSYSICLWASSNRVVPLSFWNLSLQFPIKSKVGNIFQALWCVPSPVDLFLVLFIKLSLIFLFECVTYTNSEE